MIARNVSIPLTPNLVAEFSVRTSPPPEKHFQNRGYWPLGLPLHPASEEISTLLLHELGGSLDALKSALEAQSVKVCSLRSFQEALPLLMGPNPPHLIFTQPKLPDGIWADVVSLAVKAPKPINVIVVGRLADVGLYLQTITGGAFDFIVPPLTGYELTHVLRCAIESVLSRREVQGVPHSKAHSTLVPLHGSPIDPGGSTQRDLNSPHRTRWFWSRTRRPWNLAFPARLPSRVTLGYSARKPVDAVRLGLEIDRTPDC